MRRVAGGGLGGPGLANSPNPVVELPLELLNAFPDLKQQTRQMPTAWSYRWTLNATLYPSLRKRTGCRCGACTICSS